MPYTILTKPVQGEGTKLSLIHDILDNLNELKILLGESGLSGPNIINGGFELNENNATTATGWLYQTLGGVGVVTTEESARGQKSFKVPKRAGTGDNNGGGILYSKDRFVVSEFEPLVVSWFLKCTNAGMHCKLTATFYGANGSPLTTGEAVSTMWDYEGNLPTDWEPRHGHCPVPSDARFATLHFHLGMQDNAEAGDIYIDGIQLGYLQFPHKLTFTGGYGIGVSGTHTWTPSSHGFARVTCIGGGGGGAGGGGGSSDADGGGAGGQSISYTRLVAGQSYTIIAGAGGQSRGDGSNNDGRAGGDSRFDWRFYGLGGVGGYHDDGQTETTPGGAAWGNCEYYTGANGGDWGATGNDDDGGNGGDTTISGAGGEGGRKSVHVAFDGSDFGGGGGGGRDGGDGAQGGRGAVIIEYSHHVP